MKHQQEILDQAKEYVISAYKERNKEQTPFHSLEKTWSIVDAAEKISQKEKLSEDDTFEVMLASTFLYSGFWDEGETSLNDSIEMLEDFNQSLKKTPINGEFIRELMLSIKDDSDSKTVKEEVLYDAHYAYLGRKKFTRELELKFLEENPDGHLLNVYREGLETITNHKYRTSYAIKKFGKRKAKNSQKILATIQKKEAKEKKAKRKSRKLGRGIETMYRTVYRNHINLSSIADQKANLIIRVNTIILSIIITLGGTGYTFFEDGFFKYSRFTIPVMIFVAGSLAAVIFAILSARPKVTNKEVGKKRLLGKESSILFFGNFKVMEKDDFVREMSLFRKNDDRVYDSMSVDIYYLGLVLDKKYKLVTYSYNAFMVGMTLSVLSFMVIFMLFQYT